MENSGTNQSQRSEETQWTEREYELAEKYQVEPKLIRLLAELLDEQESATHRTLAKYLQALIAITKGPEAEPVDQADAAGTEAVESEPDEDDEPEEVEDVPTKRTSLHHEHPEALWKNTYKRIRDIFLQMSSREKLLLWTFWELNGAQGFTSLDLGNDIMRRLDENFDDIGDDPELNWLKGVYQTTEMLSAHS